MPVAVSRRGVRTDTRRVRRDAERLLAHLGLADRELSVVLCDDAFIHALNREWRGKDAPTDVLSFPMDEHVLGAGVISVDTAARQGRGLPAELRVLLVHGLCHLLGHDHHTPEETSRMRALEAELLAALGETDDRGLVERAGDGGDGGG